MIPKTSFSPELGTRESSTHSFDFLSKVYIDAPTIEAMEERKANGYEKRTRPYTTEDAFYRHWERWLIVGKVTYIFLFRFDPAEIIDITPANLRYFDMTSSEYHYTISPDGRKVAFTATRSDPPHDPLLWGVFTVPIPTGPSGPEGRVSPPVPVLLNEQATAHMRSPVYSPSSIRTRITSS